MSDLAASKRAFKEAIEACGGQSALARFLSERLPKPVSQQHVWNVLHRAQDVPAEWCIHIESITQSRQKTVTRYQLRPDVFPQDAAAA